MLSTLKKLLESEKIDKSIFDIVIYGSFAKGKEYPRDIDILVIFIEGSLRERLEKIQEIKFKIKNEIKNEIDIKQSLLMELFSPSFLGKTGIFLEGISIFDNKDFSEKIGFRPYALFSYSLKNLAHAQKVRFNYLLAGRKRKGIIEEFGGERVVSGAIKIPIANSIAFEQILKNNKVPYAKKGILEEI